MGGALRRRVAGCRLGRWRDSSLGRSRRTHESFRTPVFKFAMICCVSLRLVAIALRDARSIAPVFAPGCVWLRLVQGVRWQKYGSIGSHGPPHDQRSPRLPRRREASGSRGWRSWDEHGAQVQGPATARGRTQPPDELPRRPEEDLPVTERVRPTHRPVHGHAGLARPQLEHRQARVT